MLEDGPVLLNGYLDKPLRQHELRDCLVRLYQSLPEANAAQIASVKHSDERSPMRILLAEDNKINQKYAQALLEKRFHLTIADNGLKAVELMQKHDYDLVLMDIQMPELDGLGATKQIRAMPEPKCQIPIIAMTANAQPNARAEYLAAGLNDYVTKPISPASLLELLDRYKPAAADREPQVLLEMEAIANLKAIMDEGELDSLIALFMEDTRTSLDMISTLADAGDMTGVARIAHAIVSSAGSLGARELSALARDLERKGNSGDAVAARQIAKAMGTCWDNTVPELTAITKIANGGRGANRPASTEEPVKRIA
jgi:CheY-like chemotaxis protein